MMEGGTTQSLVDAERVKAEIERTQRKVWFPPTAGILGVTARRKACTAIIGPSGVGKSHLGRQLLLDPRYGVEEVFFLMSEDSTATYGVQGLHFQRAKTFGEATGHLEALRDAYLQRERLPKVVFVDNFSGFTDYELQEFIEHPKVSQKGNRDKIAEFGLLGEAGTKFMLFARNEMPTDVVVLVTSYEGALVAEPSMAVQGKVLPKNFVRWTDVCLHMQPEAADVPAASLQDRDGGVWYNNDKTGVWERVDSPHITFGRDHRGVLDGTFISRFFYTQNDGRVQAKGHHALHMKEQAVLADVLEKIHSS